MSDTAPLIVRPAAVAGSFYPDDADELWYQLSQLIQPAAAHVAADNGGSLAGKSPKALIVPHAGYIYSGAVAGQVYASLLPFAFQYRRVILLGPAHRQPVAGLALPAAQAFATPLGEVLVPQVTCARLAQLPQVVVSASAHAREHSLEVQIPFLQYCLDDFYLLPLLVGDATPHQVAEVLQALWGDEETLLVLSSDLSHFLTYAEACRQDQATSEQILSLQGRLSGEQACGCRALNGLFWLAGSEPPARSLSIQKLALCNSGDTAGDKQRVVGYGGYLVYET